MSAAALARLAAARTRLILEHPFFGALALHLALRPARCSVGASQA